MSEGLAVASGQAAQDRWRGLSGDQQQLENAVTHVSTTLESQERERDLFRQERLGRKRQSDAGQSLLEGRESDERRVGELRDEGVGT